MIKYDPLKPLISLHIAKCGGQSLRKTLKQWFKEKYRQHYFSDNDDLPDRHELEPGICIHGHFENQRNFGVLDYYPNVSQFITFFRDPLNAALSLYFFWKKKNRTRQIKLGFIEEGGEHDYQNIDDFFLKCPRSHIPDYLPANFTRENFREEIDKKFVYIGIVEDMMISMNRLAERLGFKPKEEVWVNTSEHNETLSPELKEKFILENGYAYDIYHHARELYQQHLVE
jgi:hypothetical protein